ncbi:MAG: DUF6267 family protein [Sediminibacterium sp.]
MKTFRTFLSEEKNTHMTHIEDLVLDGGVNGARQAIVALQSLRDMLAGHEASEAKVGLTVKWDGAPAVFAGTDPTDGKFFVAKKGIFNKNPKVYKSHKDIEDDTQGDLQKKLKIAFDNLKLLGIKGVVQGDIMFTKDDLKNETIDGEEYVLFHPNTIVYAVPKNEAEDLLKAEIGVVFHTAYEGKTFEEMRASYGVDVEAFKKTTKVWAVSAGVRDVGGRANLTTSETKQVTKVLSDAGKLFQSIGRGVFELISSDTELNTIINTYNNTYIRRGERMGSGQQHVGGLIQYIHDKYQKDIDKLKTDKSKDVKIAKRQAILNNIDSHKDDLAKIIELQKLIVVAKEIIINKLNQINNTKTFVKTKHGFKVTGAEGFVAIDRIGGGAVKLVNRLEFSTNNFNPDIIKGWDSPNRG